MDSLKSIKISEKCYEKLKDLLHSMMEETGDFEDVSRETFDVFCEMQLDTACESLLHCKFNEYDMYVEMCKHLSLLTKKIH